MEIRAKTMKFPEIEELNEIQKQLKETRAKEPSAQVLACFKHFKPFLGKPLDFLERTVFENTLERVFRTQYQGSLSFEEFRALIEEEPTRESVLEEFERDYEKLELSVKTRKEILELAPFLILKVGVAPRLPQDKPFYMGETKDAWINEEGIIVWKVPCCEERGEVSLPQEILIRVVQRAQATIKALNKNTKESHEVALNNYTNPIINETVLSQPCQHCQRNTFFSLQFDFSKWHEFQVKYKT